MVARRSQSLYTHKTEATCSVHLLGTRSSEEEEGECFGSFYLVAGSARPPREPCRILFFMVIIFNLFLLVSLRDRILLKFL